MVLEVKKKKEKMQGFATALGLIGSFELLSYESSYRVSAMIFAKGLACANLLAIYGLWRQRKGYCKILEKDLSAFSKNLSRAGLFALLLLFGIAESASAFFLALFWLRAVYMVQKPFCSLQMFYQLPEATALFALGSAFSVFSSRPLIMAQQMFVLRLMLGGGLGKIRSPNSLWRFWSIPSSDPTAMSWHFWTTPLPNPMSSALHALPHIIHRIETIVTLLVEGPVGALLQLSPWAPARWVAFFLYAGLMAAINASGNYGHLGLLSVVQSASLLDDRFYLMFPSFCRAIEYITFWTYWEPQIPMVLQIIGWLLGTVLISRYMVASFLALADCYSETLLPAPYVKSCDAFCRATDWVGMLAQRGWIENDRVLQRLSDVGHYVKFANMTTRRVEVVIEVTTRDEEKTLEWPNLFKPTHVDRSPPVVLFIPGVDWQLWFCSLDCLRGGSAHRPEWLESFLQLLLDGDVDAMALMGPCPCDKNDISSIRTVLYDYRFAHDSLREPDNVGKVWQRKFLGNYGRPMYK